MKTLICTHADGLGTYFTLGESYDLVGEEFEDYVYDDEGDLHEVHSPDGRVFTSCTGGAILTLEKTIRLKCVVGDDKGRYIEGRVYPVERLDRDGDYVVDTGKGDYWFISNTSLIGCGVGNHVDPKFEVYEGENPQKATPPVNEVVWEDLEEGDVLEFLGFTDELHAHWRFTVGNLYEVREVAGKKGPVSEYGDVAAINWGFAFRKITENVSDEPQSYLEKSMQDIQNSLIGFSELTLTINGNSLELTDTVTDETYTGSASTICESIGLIKRLKKLQTSGG